MIYDVRVGALLDGSQEIYTIIQSVEASSAQEAAEQVAAASKMVRKVTKKTGMTATTMSVWTGQFDGEHTVEIDPVVGVTQTITVATKQRSRSSRSRSRHDWVKLFTSLSGTSRS